jgi:hypothetical protein
MYRGDFSHIAGSVKKNYQWIDSNIYMAAETIKKLNIDIYMSMI